MAEVSPSHFIRQIIEDDLANGKHSRIVTRFPPEPNGYLHIGHAKAICLSFGLAQEFGGGTYLRFDDTNPLTEETLYAEAIANDIRWLGFEWIDLRSASDYFEQLYAFAEQLIMDGKAYVDSLTGEQIREYRGSLTEPGRESPYRRRTPAENLDMFRRMRAGEFADGEHVLRLKIDMASPNINMRDAIIYRIRHATHHKTGDAWCIYPMYDYTHCVSDSLEGITHSLCDLGFEDHRPLYDWVLDELNLNSHPQQIEFSRLNLQFTMMSKRKLRALVEQGHVSGWDDPRLPTIAGLRRRGVPPEAIREFCRRVGVTKSEGYVELAQLESCVRDVLDPIAPRMMGIKRPLRVVLTNLQEGHHELLEAANHPKDESLGERSIDFTREIYIDRDDFREEANRKFKRLITGGEVRLRYGYVIRCDEAVSTDVGEIDHLLCSVDLSTLGKNPQGRKVRGVIHWVSAAAGIPAEIRDYDPLFVIDEPARSDEPLGSILNEASVHAFSGIVEKALIEASEDDRYQFEREGYYMRDNILSTPERPVFNRIVALRDTWAKIQQQTQSP
ncbi:MAG: glutamine--tRNA ligase [Gammaproteobacteria bacterium]|nr:glutamine--tRNA ligase [Gammaproteobacteria bacterium]